MPTENNRSDLVIPHDRFSEELQACLAACLSCYDIAPDIKGVLAKLSREPGPLRPQDLEQVLERLGLVLQKVTLRFSEIQQLKVPAVVALPKGGYEAFLPTVKKGGDFFHPESEVQPKNPEEPATAYCICPAPAKTNVVTGHMRSGYHIDWFWEPVLKFWKNYAEIMLCTVFINLFILAMPLFSMNIYDRVAVNFTQSTLFVLTGGIVIALLFDFMFKTMRTYILEHVAARVGAKYDMDLMERLMSIKQTAMTLSLGERSNIFRELQGIKDFYASRLAPSLVDLPFFFLFTGVVYYLSPMISLVPITAAVLILLINYGLQLQINRLTKAYFSSLQHKSTMLVQTLAGMNTIRMLGATGSKLFQWNVASAASIEASRKNNILSSISSNMCLLITSLVNVFVLFVGVFEIAEGTMTVGKLVACTTLSGRAIGPMVNLSGLVARLRQSMDVLKAIDKIFQLPHEDAEAAQIGAKGPFKGKIEMQNIKFKYKDQPRPALEKLSLVINPGEHVGLIGRTGAGKSTLAKMITRALEPQSGTMFLDNYALESIAPEELRREIAYIPQEAFFFSGSIRSNILLGLDNVSQSRIDEAVTLSGLEIVMQHAGIGLDSEVGEDGNRLSGGQKQSIALARALVRNPSILVFDEPTAGIDSSLEATIKAGLSKYLVGRTFVMITHRTSLLSLVDRLVLVDRGRVAADGPREEILKKLGGM